jgi:hypothetical protein
MLHGNTTGKKVQSEKVDEWKREREEWNSNIATMTTRQGEEANQKGESEKRR